MRRRDFVSRLCTGAGLAAVAPLVDGRRGWRSAHTAEAATNPLVIPRRVRGTELRLVAGVGTADLGIGRSEAWMLDGSLPAPTIELRRGERARIELVNQLPEPTILHWHGLDVPEAADGHPRFAIARGERYRYDFEVGDRAGTYWYHPHTHQRTGAQTYLGMAGLLIVRDDEEDALGLPAGELELPLLLQDKRLGEGATLAYDPGMGPDLMLGFLGDTPVANGVVDATVEVRRATYRLRLLNGSNARIFDIGLAPGAPMTLIGADGGLLPSPVEVERVMLGTGERADLLVDFSRFAPGTRVRLRSFPFEVPGMMGMMMGGRMGRGRGMGGMMRMGGLAQGAEMDLLELVVGEGPAEPAPRLPTTLSEVAPRPVDAETPRRSFRFDSRMMQHTINGRPFEMERVDTRVPLGRTELWSLINDSELPHPVHVHVGSFRVVERRGGRGRVMPWERGPKDTVLIMPGEEVDVAVHFARHPGLFLLHCHNLEHEDAGMMSNFEVVG